VDPTAWFLVALQVLWQHLWLSFEQSNLGCHSYHCALALVVEQEVLEVPVEVVVNPNVLSWHRVLQLCFR